MQLWVYADSCEVCTSCHVRQLFHAISTSAVKFEVFFMQFVVAMQQLLTYARPMMQFKQCHAKQLDHAISIDAAKLWFVFYADYFFAVRHFDGAKTKMQVKRWHAAFFLKGKMSSGAAKTPRAEGQGHWFGWSCVGMFHKTSPWTPWQSLNLVATTHLEGAMADLYMGCQPRYSVGNQL